MKSGLAIVACLLCIFLPVSGIFHSLSLPHHFVQALKKPFFRRGCKRAPIASCDKKIASKLDDDTFCSNIDSENKEALDILLGLVNSDKGWTYVGTKLNVSVYRRFLPAGKFVNIIDAMRGGKHACVKSSTIVNASADAVFQLFADNARVHEYNDHIVEVRDIKTFPKSVSQEGSTWTKLAWSSSPKYGPFKARDFFSVVNYRILDPQESDSTTPAMKKYIIVNRPAYLSTCPPDAGYVRATVLLGGNIIEPLSEAQSRVTMVAHINAGGSADHPAAAWIANKLCSYGPPTFLRKIEQAAQKLDRQKKTFRNQ